MSPRHLNWLLLSLSLKKTQLDPNDLRTNLESPFSVKDTRKGSIPRNCIPSWRKIISVRIYSQDLDHLLRLLSLE